MCEWFDVDAYVVTALASDHAIQRPYELIDWVSLWGCHPSCYLKVCLLQSKPAWDFPTHIALKREPTSSSCVLFWCRKWAFLIHKESLTSSVSILDRECLVCDSKRFIKNDLRQTRYLRSLAETLCWQNFQMSLISGCPVSGEDYALHSVYFEKSF